jgi:molybdopterin-guanine dinucleotide biosynthesis protein B
LYPKIVSVIGAKKSEKTTTIENLISELTKRGLKVAVIKHVPERYFTIDTPGKDSFRYSAHGAKIVIAVSANETATIEKIPSEAVPFSKLFKKCKGNDIIFLIEVKRTFAKKMDIPKIAIAKNLEEVQFALETYKPIIAFSGPFNTQTLIPTIPYADGVKNPEMLADIIIEKIFKE